MKKIILPDPKTLRRACVDLLSEMIRIPSPFFREEKIAQFLMNRLSAYPDFQCRLQSFVERELVDFEYHGFNVIADYGPCDQEIVVFNGHMDTVMPTKDWTDDPHEPRIEGDRMYGLGSVDMKGGIAAWIIAMEQLSQMGFQPRKGIRMIAVSDEEGPYSLGTLHSYKAGFYQNASIVVIGEPVVPFSWREIAFPAVALGGRGRYLHRIQVYGKPGHGALPQSGENAISRAAVLATALDKMSLHSHTFQGDESLCILKIEGGQITITIPDACTLYVDRHVVAGTTKEMVENEFWSYVERHTPSLLPHIDLVFREILEDGALYQPYWIPVETPMIQKLIQSTETALGSRPSITSFLSICDLNYLAPRLNVPVILFGPDGGQFHQANEYVTISSLEKTVQVIMQFLIDSCG